MIKGSKILDFDAVMEKGFSLIEEGGLQKNFGLLLIVGVNTGLRVGDLLTVTFDDLKQGSFVVNEEKTSKARNIVVNNNIKRALEYFEGDLMYELGGKCFISKKGTVYSKQHVNLLLKKYFGKGFSSHGMRKAFGARLYERSGKEISIVQMQLQHSDPSVTLRYIGVTQERLNNCFNDIL